MELVFGMDSGANVCIPVNDLGHWPLPPADQLGIDLDSVNAVQNATMALPYIDPSSPKIARMPREAVAPALLPFAPLLLVIFSIAYMYFDKFLHSVFLPRVYGTLFSTQNPSHRLTFALHHNALFAFGSVLIVGIIPIMCVLVGETTFSDPLVVGSPVTVGNWIFVLAIAYCSTYLGEMFVRRDQPGLVPKIHHITVLLVALATIGITGNVEHNRSATVSFYIISVWCVFDVVSEIPIHAGLILWRCARDYAGARTLSKVMLCMALWRLATVLANLGVTVFLIYTAWRKLSTVWTVLAPVAAWVWFYAQLQSAHVLYGISRRVRREYRAAERAKRGEGGGESYSLEEYGGPPRSGMLFNDPAYAGLTLGTTLLSYTHASGAGGRLLSSPNRTHLAVLLAVGLAIGVTMLLIRYFTQDASGTAGLAARSLDVYQSQASSIMTRDLLGNNNVQGVDKSSSNQGTAPGNGNSSSSSSSSGGGGGGGGGDGHGGVMERSTGLVTAVAEALREAHDNTTAAAAAETAPVVDPAKVEDGDDATFHIGVGGISSAQSEENEKRYAARLRRDDDWDDPVWFR